MPADIYDTATPLPRKLTLTADKPQWFNFVFIVGEGITYAKANMIVPEKSYVQSLLIGYGTPDEVLNTYVFHVIPIKAKLKTWRGLMPVALCRNQFGDEYISLLPVDCSREKQGE